MSIVWAAAEYLVGKRNHLLPGLVLAFGVGEICADVIRALLVHAYLGIDFGLFVVDISHQRATRLLTWWSHNRVRGESFIWALGSLIGVGAMYLRFRKPAFLLLLCIAFVRLSLATPEAFGAKMLSGGDRFVVSLIAGSALAVGAFALDFSDPMRLTRRSESAFWIHLTAAPLVVLPAVVLLSRFHAHAETESVRFALVAAPLCAAFALLSIAADRRMLLMATLATSSVVLSFWLRPNVPVDNTERAIFFAALLFGIASTTTGLAWRRMRNGLIALIPSKLARFIPPADPVHLDSVSENNAWHQQNQRDARPVFRGDSGVRLFDRLDDLYLAGGIAMMAIGAIGIGGTIAPLSAIAAYLGLAHFAVDHRRAPIPSGALVASIALLAATLVGRWAGYLGFFETPRVGGALSTIAVGWWIGVWLSVSIVGGVYLLRFRLPFSLLLVAGGLIAALASAGSVLSRSERFFEIAQVSDYETASTIPPAVLALVGAVIAFVAARKLEEGGWTIGLDRAASAFWLHVAVAASIVWALEHSLVGPMLNERFGDSIRQNVVHRESVAVARALMLLVAAVGLVVVGLACDRRVYVLAALYPTFWAAVRFTKAAGLVAPASEVAATIGVGLIVLVIAVGWRRLRRAILDALPAAASARLPRAA